MVEFRQLFPPSTPKPQTSSQGTIAPPQVVTPTAESYYRSTQQAQASTPVVLTGTTTVQQKQEAERVVSTVPSREEVAQRYPGQGLEEYHYLITKKPSGGWDIRAAQQAKFGQQQQELAAREPERTAARAANVERQQAVQRVYEDIQSFGSSTTASRAAYTGAAERETAAMSRYGTSLGYEQPRAWTTIAATTRTAAPTAITSVSAPITVAEVSSRYGTQYKGYEGLITRTPAGGMDLRLADTAKMSDYEVGLAQAYPARTAAHAALAERQAAVQTVYEDIQRLGYSTPQSRARYAGAAEKEYQSTLALPREAATRPRPGAPGAPQVAIMPGASEFSRSLGVGREAQTLGTDVAGVYQAPTSVSIPQMPAAGPREAFGLAAGTMPGAGLGISDWLSGGRVSALVTSPERARGAGGILGITPETAPGIATRLTTLPVIGGLFALERSALEAIARPKESPEYARYRTETEAGIRELEGVKSDIGAARTRYETAAAPLLTEYEAVHSEFTSRVSAAGYGTDAQGRIVIPREDTTTWALARREQELVGKITPLQEEYKATTAPLLSRQATLLTGLEATVATAEAKGTIKKVEGGYVPGTGAISSGYIRGESNLDKRAGQYTKAITPTESGMAIWRTGTERMYTRAGELAEQAGTSKVPTTAGAQAVGLLGLAVVSDIYQRTTTELKERPVSGIAVPFAEAAALSYGIGALGWGLEATGVTAGAAQAFPRLAAAGPTITRALPYVFGGLFGVTAAAEVRAAPAEERPQVAVQQALKGTAFIAGWETGAAGWGATVAGGRAAVRTISAAEARFETPVARGFYTGGGPETRLPGIRAAGVEVPGVGRIGYASGETVPGGRQLYYESLRGMGEPAPTVRYGPGRPFGTGGVAYDGAGISYLGEPTRLPAVRGEMVPTLYGDVQMPRPVYFLPAPELPPMSLITTKIGRSTVGWGTESDLPTGRLEIPGEALTPADIAIWPGRATPTRLALIQRSLSGPGVVAEPSRLPRMYEQIATTWPEMGYEETRLVGARQEFDIVPARNLPSVSGTFMPADIGGARITEILPYTPTVRPYKAPAMPSGGLVSGGMIVGGGYDLAVATEMATPEPVMRPVYRGAVSGAQVWKLTDYTYGLPATGTEPVRPDDLLGRFYGGKLKRVRMGGGLGPGYREYEMESGEIFRVSERGGRSYLSQVAGPSVRDVTGESPIDWTAPLVGEGVGVGTTARDLTGEFVSPIDWTAPMEIGGPAVTPGMRMAEMPEPVFPITRPIEITGEVQIPREDVIPLITEITIPVEIQPEVEVTPIPVPPIETPIPPDVIPPLEPVPPWFPPKLSLGAGTSQFEGTRRRKKWWEVLPLESPWLDERISAERLPRSIRKTVKMDTRFSAKDLSKMLRGGKKAPKKKKGRKGRSQDAEDILGEMGW